MKSRIYIIDGQDRCGKSTTVNLLRKHIKNPKILVVHSSKPPSGVDVEDWTIAHYSEVVNNLQAMADEGWDIIMDRSWLGESVYGPIYRNVDIGLSTLEDDCLPFKEDTERFKLLILVDDASSIASRSDGESMSDDLNMLESERSGFKAAFEATSITSKELIDWEYEEFSVKLLEQIVLEMING